MVTENSVKNSGEKTVPALQENVLQRILSAPKNLLDTSFSNTCTLNYRVLQLP